VRIERRLVRVDLEQHQVFGRAQHLEPQRARLVREAPVAMYEEQWKEAVDQIGRDLVLGDDGELADGGIPPERGSGSRRRCASRRFMNRHWPGRRDRRPGGTPVAIS
jgi:hypothetical protein